MHNVKVEASVVSVINWSPDELDEFIRDYEPELRRMIGAKLGTGPLRRDADSADICQSVFRRYLAREADQAFDIESVGQLKKLLRTIALNLIRDIARRKRPVVNEYPSDLPDPDSSLSSRVARDDLIAQFRERLSPVSRQIHQWKIEGLTWAQIGERLDEPSQTVRVRLARGNRPVNRVFPSVARVAKLSATQHPWEGQRWRSLGNAMSIGLMWSASGGPVAFHRRSSVGSEGSPIAR